MPAPTPRSMLGSTRRCRPTPPRTPMPPTPGPPTDRAVRGGARVKMSHGLAGAIAATGARIAEALIVVGLLASLVFFALRILPGDPAALVLGDDASPAELARIRAVLHLDRPLLVQYGEFLRGLV